MDSILIHETDESARDRLRDMLCLRYPLVITANKEQFLAALKQTHPSKLIFLGLETGGNSDLAAQARTLSTKTTIIAIGDSQHEDSAREAVRAGADGYMLKPVIEQEILATAVKYLTSDQMR